MSPYFSIPGVYPEIDKDERWGNSELCVMFIDTIIFHKIKKKIPAKTVIAFPGPPYPYLSNSIAGYSSRYSLLEHKNASDV